MPESETPIVKEFPVALTLDDEIKIGLGSDISILLTKADAKNLIQSLTFALELMEVGD